MDHGHPLKFYKMWMWWKRGKYCTPFYIRSTFYKNNKTETDKK